MKYLSHGFPIDVDLDLPPGVLMDEGSADRPGIHVQQGQVRWRTEPDPNEEGFEVEHGQHRFFWPILGSASLDEAGTVLLDPRAEAPRGILPHAILGPLCAHWIYVQKRIALHANCVAVDDRLLALVGSSGAGKSSLAAALVSRGALPHGDDVISLEPRSGLVPFGTSRIKLNPDILEQLVLKPVSVSELYDGLDKQSVQFAIPANTSERKLEVVYRLNDAPSGTSPTFQEVTGFPLALGLLAEIYRPHVAAHAFGLEEILRRCSSLVNRVRMFDLSRSRELHRLSDLAGEVIAHFQSLQQ